MSDNILLYIVIISYMPTFLLYIIFAQQNCNYKLHNYLVSIFVCVAARYTTIYLNI